MKKILIKSIIPLLGVLFLLESCKKDTTTAPLGDAGKTVVRISGGGDAPAYAGSLLGVNFLATTQVIDALDIRRETPNAGELATSMTVVVKDDTAALRAYNLANGSNALPLPRAWYTANFPATGIGGTYTVTFAPGDFAKTISLTIPNSTLLDPSATYGLAFTILSTNPSVTISSGKTYVFMVGAKNAYDGIYSVVSGNVQRYSAPGVPTTGDALNGSLAGNGDVTMTTTGANTVYMYGIRWHDGANGGLVGGVDPIYITVDPSTNTTNSNSTTNLTLGNWLGHTNKYDPATKTFYLAMRWNPLTTTREYEIVLKYKQPR